ncbi:MAG: winged helix-turn-helix domain-containing protein [Terriglobia bacterium]|jgi:hypothetical protein
MDTVRQDDAVPVLKEILKWIRIQATPSVKSTLDRTLASSAQRKLYQALDGQRKQKELSNASGISQPRISRLLSAWQRAGIVEQTSPAKYSRLFDLEELGISIEKLTEE